MSKVSETSVTSASSKTFVFSNEGHTLGNALRHVVMQDPRTAFTGYTVPHPSEPDMHLRIQTFNDVPSDAVLREATSTLKGVCESLRNSFKKSLE